MVINRLTIPQPTYWGGIFLIFPLLLNPLLHAGSKTGADFLKIPVGARMVGMGQAATAVSAGTDALNWNPAGMSVKDPLASGANGLGLSFSHLSTLSENTFDQFGVIVPKGPVTFGFNALRMSYEQQQGRASNRAPTSHFSPSSTAFGMGLATQISGIHVGTQLKWINEKLASESADGLSADIGILAATPISKLSLGSSIRHIGPPMKFIHEENRLPLTITLGGAFQALPALSLSVDVVNLPHQKKTTLAFGSELMTTSVVSLRAGYIAKLAESITNNQEDETNRGNIGDIGGLSAGLGLRFNQFRFDYAFSPFGELGDNHVVTLSTRFSTPNKISPSTPSTVGAKREAIIFDLDSDAPELKTLP